jgi:hypothetical protein
LKADGRLVEDNDVSSGRYMRSANHRPAFVDLFAALLIASFGGFIILTGAYQQELRFPEDAA